MFGFFPNPRQDELLFGLLSRLSHILGVPAADRFVEACFGNAESGLYPTFPSRLSHLAALIPAEDWTFERLVQDHTQFPYFASFIDDGLRETLLAGMAGNWNRTTIGAWRTLLLNIHWPRSLNFCPDCVESDLQEAGKSTWRRVHQLPGVFVCPMHGSGLRGLPLPNDPDIWPKLVDCPGDPAAGVPLKPRLDGGMAMSVARNSLWLLTHPPREVSPLALRVAVWELLRRGGWVSEANGVLTDLRLEMAVILGRDHLESLGCGLDLRKNNVWVAHLWQVPEGPGDRETASRRARQPLRYLLLLAFLGREASELFDVVDKFRTGPPGAFAIPPATTVWATRTELLRTQFTPTFKDYLARRGDRTDGSTRT